MRTEYVIVRVDYLVRVDVEDDATANEVLDAVETEYVNGELREIEDHTVDPDGEWTRNDPFENSPLHDATVESVDRRESDPLAEERRLYFEQHGFADDSNPAPQS